MDNKLFKQKLLVALTKLNFYTIMLLARLFIYIPEEHFYFHLCKTKVLMLYPLDTVSLIRLKVRALLF